MESNYISHFSLSEDTYWTYIRSSEPKDIFQFSVDPYFRFQNRRFHELLFSDCIYSGLTVRTEMGFWNALKFAISKKSPEILQEIRNLGVAEKVPIFIEEALIRVKGNKLRKKIMKEFGNRNLFESDPIPVVKTPDSPTWFDWFYKIWNPDPKSDNNSLEPKLDLIEFISKKLQIRINILIVFQDRIEYASFNSGVRVSEFQTGSITIAKYQKTASQKIASQNDSFYELLF